ncbi:acyltransferase [Salinibacterium sp. G-O1]|uniref:acyltransferase family protein n=1 Tax=Salinibacterium sp. G-O1 TaxID=3046208 RepID=UPI0024B9C07A|nr:acyltransferase [Salinibacterium sp. G-O1]MDJ0336572.1 acyltransferase [Salinibacterium sp. G-O1]
MRAEVNRDNNFDAVRLVAAVAVVVGHAWPLTGLSHAPRIGGIPLFTLAVFVFFSLSGYLVGTSWVRDPRLLPFLARRASRIFPALIVVVVLTTFVLGPLATALPLLDYFTSAQTWTYLTNVTLVASYELPGVFAANPRPVVNGVLWTLGPEFLCYVGVMVVATVAVALRARHEFTRAAVFAVVGVVLAIVSSLPLESFDGPRPALTAMVFFAIGAAVSQLPLHRLPLWPAAVLIPAWLLGGALTPEFAQVMTWITLPYLVLCLGSRATPFVRRAGRFGDVSYGVYLWGYLIQQLVWQAWPNLALVTDLIIVVALTLAVAWASWHLVEKRALAAIRNRLRVSPATSAVLVPTDT